MNSLLKRLNFIGPAMSTGLKLFGAAVFLGCSASALATGGSTTIVNCNDGVNDLSRIQAAVNAAQPYDTIQINGICDMAGGYPVFINKSDLTITGNPYAYKYDPSQMTVMKGVVGTDGRPTGSGRDGGGCYNNRSFFIASLDPTFTGVIKNVTIKNIKFSDQWTSVWLLPSAFSNRFTQTPRTCSGAVTPTSARAENITIKDNHFDNVVFGILLYGEAKNVYAMNNNMNTLGGGGITGLGRWVNFNAGQLQNLVVSGNKIRESGSVGIDLDSTKSALVIGNYIQNALEYGIGVHNPGSDPSGEIDSNIIALNNVRGSVNASGYDVYDGAQGAALLFNKGSNNTAAGFTDAPPGVFPDGPVDAWLEGDFFYPTSSNNLVITFDCNFKVVDDGLDNLVLGQEHCP